MLGVIFMQSIMYHLKCHSFSDTIIILFLGDGQKKNCWGHSFNTVSMPFFCLLLNLTVRNLRYWLRELGESCYQSWISYVFHSCALLCAQIQVTPKNQVKANRELWGQNARKKGGCNWNAKQCWRSTRPTTSSSQRCVNSLETVFEIMWRALSSCSFPSTHQLNLSMDEADSEGRVPSTEPQPFSGLSI